jgi:hypothetical protein
VHSELLLELSSLQNALDGVEKFGSHSTLFEALRNCQKYIDAFVERIKKFRSIDKDYGASKWSVETFKNNLRAVEWAICKKTEVTEFQQAVLFHAAAILSLQISQLR